MAMPERSFGEIFGTQPDPSEDISMPTIEASLYGAAVMLQENPSEAAILDTINVFSQKPYDYTSQAARFLRRDPDIDERENPADPLIIVKDVITRIDQQRAVFTGEFYEGFDPQVCAKYIFRDVRVRIEEKKWGDKYLTLSNEQDPTRQGRLALRIKTDIQNLVKSGQISFVDHDRKVIPTWENISRGSAEALVQFQDSEEPIGSLDRLISEANRVIERAKLEALLEREPKFDKERFNELRKKFGAKAANLILLQDIAPRINEFLGRRFDRDKIRVPDFKVVPVDIYQKWQAGENIDQDLKPYFEWVSNLTIDGYKYYFDEPDAYIVRSSAVNSEDGEELSGAGVYRSVVVDYDNARKYGAFKRAVVSVFRSTNSSAAKSYRGQNSIPTEEMGLVIQRLRPDKYGDDGFGRRSNPNVVINSQTPGISGLIEVTSDGSRLFAKKDVINKYLASEIPKSAAHFPLDNNKAPMRTGELIKYSVWTAVLERLWGGSVQLECVGGEIVQIRRVTHRIDSSKIIEFPEGNELARGNGIGIGDVTLTVLGSREYNYKKKGVVQFHSNDQWTNNGNSDYFPKTGAVIVRRNAGYNGHLQTLCVERDLLCMYPREQSDIETLPDLRRGARIRIVSNGIEARMYRVAGENPVESEETYSYDDGN